MENENIKDHEHFDRERWTSIISYCDKEITILNRKKSEYDSRIPYNFTGWHMALSYGCEETLTMFEGFLEDAKIEFAEYVTNDLARLAYDEGCQA